MNRGVQIGLYVGVFMLAAVVSACLTMYFIIKGQPEVEVPDLTGQGAITALKALSDLGLNLKVQAHDFSDHTPKDHIVSQDPPAGTRIKRQREVRVILSKGSATAPMPDLRGLPMAQASSILEQTRLQPGQISYTWGEGPEQVRDGIIAQDPEPMTLIHSGTRVDLLVSLGPRPVYLVMPDLTGQLYSLSLYTLERAGLALGRLDNEDRSNWPAETVVLQEPGPGSRVAKGTLVRLVINRAEEKSLTEYKFYLVVYPLPPGLFRHEIKVRVAIGPYLVDQYDKWHNPGELVRLATLARGQPRVQIFDDGEEKTVPRSQDFLKGVLDVQDRAFYPFSRFLSPGG